jgi:hypothetical protein
VTGEDKALPDMGGPSPLLVDSLSADATGRWEVFTEASAYLLDLDARTATRVPGAGAVWPGDQAPVAQLRRDHRSVPLLRFTGARVGQPMTLVLDIRGDGVETARHTTYVMLIRRAASDAGGSWPAGPYPRVRLT